MKGREPTLMDLVNDRTGKIETKRKKKKKDKKVLKDYLNA